MKNIVFAGKIVLGIAMVLLTAYLLSSFRGAAELIFGAVLMLAGVASGALVQKRHRRLFAALSLLSLVITVLFYFSPALSVVQYFSGGFLVYFACALMFDRKNAVIS